MNKIVKIETGKTKPKIDWSKNQYVMSDGGTLVYFIGNHSGENFEGIALGSNSHLPHLAKNWDKSQFRPLAPGEIVTVQFSND